MDPSTRQTVAQALQFLGMLTSIGGSLTIIVRGFRDPFFYILMILGIVMWVAGLILRSRT